MKEVPGIEICRAFFYSHQKELLSQQRIRRRKPYEE